MIFHTSSLTSRRICGNYGITAFYLLIYFAINWCYASWVRLLWMLYTLLFCYCTFICASKDAAYLRFHVYIAVLCVCVCLSKSACGAADTLPLLSPQTGRHGCSVCDQGGAHSFLWQPLGQRRRLQVWPSVCPFNEQLWLQVVWGPLVTSWSGNAPENQLDIDLKSTVF